jgi:hypothetical protein
VRTESTLFRSLRRVVLVRMVFAVVLLGGEREEEFVSDVRRCVGVEV